MALGTEHLLYTAGRIPHYYFPPQLPRFLFIRPLFYFFLAFLRSGKRGEGRINSLPLPSGRFRIPRAFFSHILHLQFFLQNATEFFP